MKLIMESWRVQQTWHGFQEELREWLVQENYFTSEDIKLIEKVKQLDKIRDDISISMYGDPSLSRRDLEQNESISSKVGIVIWNMWRNRSEPTQTNNMLYDNASFEFEKVISQMTKLDAEIKGLEKYLEEKEVPFTPGRGLIMNWSKE